MPKSLRPRWRYLAVTVEAWPDADLDRRSFQRALWRSGRRLLGDPGSADADLRVVRFRASDDGAAAEAVVRARREHRRAARAAVACVDAVDGDRVGVAVRGVSGTIRGVERFLDGPADGEATTVPAGGGRRRAVVRGGAVDVAGSLPADPVRSGGYRSGDADSDEDGSVGRGAEAADTGQSGGVDDRPHAGGDGADGDTFTGATRVDTRTD